MNQMKSYPMLLLATAGTITPVLTFVAHADDGISDPKQATAQKVALTSSPDYKEADAKIATQQKKGMHIDVKEKTVKVKTAAERDQALKDAEADAKKQLVKLNADSLAYDKWAGTSTGLEGTKPGDINQQLLIKKSPNAKATLSNVSSAVTTKQIKQSEFKNVISSSTKAIKSTSAYEIAKKASGLTAVNGHLATVSYTNLDASYAGKKITKIVYDFQDLEKNNTNHTSEKPRFYAFNDPTDTIWYNATEGVTIVPHFYGPDGQEIKLSDKSAYATAGSLNGRYSSTNSAAKYTKKGKAFHVESVQLKSGGTITQLQGSSIRNHANDAYADETNQGNAQTVKDGIIPSSIADWDNATSPKRIYGATALNLDNTKEDTKIRFHTTRADNKDGVGVWATLSTTIDPSLPAPKGEFTKTKVILEPAEMPKPIKSRLDQNGNITTSKDVKLGDTLSYGLSAKIPATDAKGNPLKTAQIVDPYVDAFGYKTSKIKLTDAKGQDITNDFKFEDKKGLGATWTAKDATKYVGKTVFVMPEFEIKSEADLAKYEQDGKLVFPNTVYLLVNGEKVPGNTVVVTPKGKITPVDKAYVGNISDWKLHKVKLDSQVTNQSNKAASQATSSDANQTVDAKNTPAKTSKSGVTEQAKSSTATKTAATTAKSTSKSDAVAVHTVKIGDKFGYTLNTTVDAIDEQGQLIKSFSLNDPLEKALAFDGVQIVDQTDKNKDITDDFAHTGRISSALHEKKVAQYRGHKLQMRIGAHIDEKQDLSAYKQSDGSYVIKNVASKTQNGHDTPSNEVDIKVTKTPGKSNPAPKETPQPEKPTYNQKAPNTGTTNRMTQLYESVKHFFGIAD
ncbi:isopeptide-forming domain-containing fimbrial protein [Weissella viridescens]|nr:isopeptide-forming domain-containing fimbrial protein [Weissella viridescens]